MTQGNTEGAGQGTEALGAERGGGPPGPVPDKQGWLSLLQPVYWLAQMWAVEACDELG